MKEITKWLTSLQPQDYLESSSTSSVYYIVAGLKIRLADHFTPKPKDSDLHIICPINDDSIYIVTIKEGLQVVAFKSLDKLKEFVYNYSLFHRIQTTTDNMKIPKKTDDKKSSIVNAANRTTNDETWGYVVNYIREDFPEWSNLTKSYKKLCKGLFASPTDYNKCIEVMKEAFGAKNISKESISSYFEPYINSKIKQRK